MSLTSRSPASSSFSSSSSIHDSSLRHARQAPQYLDRRESGPTLLSTVIPFLPMLSAFAGNGSGSEDTPEGWLAHEQLLVSCLRTGDDRSALRCLERLAGRFGPGNERVMGLRGLYEEATAAAADDGSALEGVLKGYEQTLEANAANMAVAKRRVALLGSLGRPPAAAIAALVGLLDTCPTDAEAWAELADLYLAQSMHAQAVYCLEEVLLIVPNAWNVHARIGEVLYMSANHGGPDQAGALTDAVRRYCRSIELCDDYLRGYYGLKLATDRLLELASTADEGSNNKNNNNDDENNSSSSSRRSAPAPLSTQTIQRLGRKATAKLADIVARLPTGYDEAELVAAKALLDRTGGNAVRGG